MTKLTAANQKPFTLSCPNLVTLLFIRKTHSDQTVSNWKTFSLCLVGYALLIIMELSFVIHKLDIKMFGKIP